jgi:hypothetical protein
VVGLVPNKYAVATEKSWLLVSHAP